MRTYGTSAVVGVCVTKYLHKMMRQCIIVHVDVLGGIVVVVVAAVVAAKWNDTA